MHQEDAAIKMIKGRGRESELLREIAILERAKTQYVVRFLGYAICQQGILLCMEYLPGGRHPPPYVISLASHIAIFLS